MKTAIQFLTQHGYLVLFLVVLADQIGLPLPAIPFLMATGALVKAGSLGVTGAIAVSVVASLFGHWVWYEAGRRRGARVLALLCRISIEPDACVRQTENLFERHGAKSLLIADFIPGLGTVAQPLAGMSGMSLVQFVFLDVAGALLWSGAYLALGWVFSDQLELLAETADAWGGRIGLVVVGIVLAYFSVKFARRRQLLGQKLLKRVFVEEVKAMIDRGERMTLIDLRHRRQQQAYPFIIPGARMILLEEIGEVAAGLPEDQDIILYCS